MGKIVSYGIFLAIIIGLIFPIGSEYKFLIPILLAIILFFSFLKLDYKLNNFFRKELFYYFIIGLVIIPFIVYITTQGFDDNLRLGIFLVSITPTAIGAPIVVDIIKGNRELIVSNVVLYNMLSPITYTVLLNIYFSKSDLIIPANQIFIKLATMIFVPFILAIIIRKFIKLKDNLSKISKWVSPISFILVIGVAVSSSSLYLRELEAFTLIKIAMITLVLAAISFIVGSLLSKKRETRKTLTVIFGHKNSALTTWVALSNFAPQVVIPVVIYIIFHHIINSILIHKYADS